MKLQRLILILFTALIGLFSYAANAVLIDQGDTVFDTEANLLWLDLSQTDAMPYSVAGSTFAADGWVYATEAQYEAMFDSFFTGYVGNTSGFMRTELGSAQHAQIVLFSEMFGFTLGGSGSFAASYGFYEDSSGILRLGGVSAGSKNVSLYRDFNRDYNDSRTSGLDEIGVFLVKSVAVPEPGSLLLLSLGLAGLGFYRRKVL